MNDEKENWRDMCKSHSARSVKEFCRACPSKLSKKELEDVYFTLLEDNLNLKTTINSQHDKIKILSTKIQRLMAIQKTYLGKEPKDCCGSKAVINEQKECISELKRSNHSLTERIRLLNTRLCSTKQFLKKNPFQSTSRCVRCSNKNASMGALNTKRSESNLRTEVASCQYLDKDMVSSRTGDHDAISHDKGVLIDLCDDNKCRNLIEGLKQENEELRQELLRINKTNGDRMSQLEQQLSEMREESLRVRTECTNTQLCLHQAREEAVELAKRLAAAENRRDELNVELAIEQRKVAELAVRVRAADLSRRVASTVEAHLASIKLIVPESPCRPKPAVRTKLPRSPQHDEALKNSDDSGYTEVNKSQEVENKKVSTYDSQMLLEKISDLQNQIDNMKSLKNNYYNPVQISRETVEKNDERDQNRQTLIVKKIDDDNIISKSSDSVISENNLRIVDTTFSKENNYCESQIRHENKVSTPINVNPDTQMPSNEFINGQVEKQVYNSNVDTKRRYSFTPVRRKDKNHEPNEFPDYPLPYNSMNRSIDSPKESLVERNLIKTGSMDENKNVNLDNIKTFDKKPIKGHEINTVLNDTNRSNKASKNEKKLADRCITATIINNAEFKKDCSENSQTMNSCKVDYVSKKDSDFSNNTYSIHRDEKGSSLTSKLAPINKSETPCKDKVTEVIERKKINKLPLPREGVNIHVNDMKSVLNSALRKNFTADMISDDHRRACRDLSPNNTECEISSLSDLPSEKYERGSRKYLSPGEELQTTASSDRDTTTDYGSLSEGEVPCVRANVMSPGEQRIPGKTVKSSSVPLSSSQQMEAALAEVQQELQRCTSLLEGRTQLILDDLG